MEHINKMENMNPGKPGLLALGGWLFMDIAHYFTQADVTFYIGCISAALGGTYYAIQIIKSLKKK